MVAAHSIYLVLLYGPMIEEDVSEADKVEGCTLHFTVGIYLFTVSIL